MYYLAKFAQAMGLGIIAVGFFKNYPALMNPRIFYVGILLFTAGWVIQRFWLRR